MSKKINEIDLATIPTLDLIDELTDRCSPSVFIGYKDEGAGSGVNTYHAIRGEESVCYGLCHQMAFKIQRAETRRVVREELEEE